MSATEHALYVHNQLVVMSSAYVSSGICAVLYTATLIRITLKTKMILLAIMVTLLLVSQLAFMAKE